MSLATEDGSSSPTFVPGRLRQSVATMLSAPVEQPLVGDHAGLVIRGRHVGVGQGAGHESLGDGVARDLRLAVA